MRPDFLDKLYASRKFSGPFAQRAPWQQLTILHGGKLYASDNQRIVEIECATKGSAVFAARTVGLIKSFREPPNAMKIGKWIEFKWDDGRSLRVRNDYDHDDVVSKLRSLLDAWHGHDEVDEIEVDGRGIAVKAGDAVVGDAVVPRSGFFFTPGKETPSQRLASGAADLRNDDYFFVARKELESDKRANVRRKKRLEDEQVRIEKELARVKRALAEDNKRIAAFEDAVSKYLRGDELTDDEKARLRPTCESVVRKAEGEELKAAIDKLPKLPKTLKGWEQCADRNDGEYVYVTYRQRLPETETRKKSRERIEEAVETVFEPDFPRDALVPVWQSLTSIEPRAGP